MNKILIYCFLFLTCICCQSLDKPITPKNILTEDRMVEILSDMAFINAAKSSNRKVFEENSINPESIILKKYNIDSATFAQNNAWYSSKFEKYKDIVTRVKANIEKETTRHKELQKKEDSLKAIQDSIRINKRLEQGKSPQSNKEEEEINIKSVPKSN